MANWGWVTPEIYSLLRKLSTCLKLFQFLLGIASVYLLIRMEVFGAVGTITMDNWDWETITTDLFQKKSKTYRQSYLLLHLVRPQSFLIIMDQYGGVGQM